MSFFLQNLGTEQQMFLVLTLTLLVYRAQVTRFKILTSFLVVSLLSSVAYTVLLRAVSLKLMSDIKAYECYFYVYWVLFAVKALLKLGIIYELYQLAMEPLPGLQRLGRLIFRWAAAIAVCVAIGMAMGPHLSGENILVRSMAQFQQTESILSLCLLLFVSIAAQPLGLSSRSRLFGVSLGLGLLSTSELVQAAWLSHIQNMANLGDHMTEMVFIAVMGIWVAYFAMPEPKRQMIILPTTSPFLRWNQIAQALGDAPGFVAVGGFDPSFLAPAEVEIMERASVKMKMAEARPVIAFENDRREAVSA